MMAVRWHIAGLLLLLAGAGLAAEPGVPPEAVVVLANQRVPDSVAIAREYMKGRGLPEECLVVLDLPTIETITRSFYEDRLREPLLAALRKRGVIEQVSRDPKSVRAHETPWKTVRSTVRFIISTYGVPVRIADTQPWAVRKVSALFETGATRDGAAVDSELAALFRDPYEISGRIPNPIYNQVRWADLGEFAKDVVIAARLDGPDTGAVRRMMKDALRVDDVGLLGRVYIDTRAHHFDDYFLGDSWFLAAAERLRLEGYEVVVDRQDPVWGAAFPMEDAAFYGGWYVEKVDGPFLRDGFAFKPGAFAYHLHSANAKELRQGTNYWTGPLLARGAAFSTGTVKEPYLPLTPDISIFVDRLCRGFTYGESMYMSMSALSWQSTVVGDPLSRPFGVSPATQISNLESNHDPAVAWVYLRVVNRMLIDGKFNPALAYLRSKIESTGSLVLRERLADLYAINQLVPEAVTEYQRIVDEATTAETAIRCGARLVLALRHLGRNVEASGVMDDLRKKWGTSPMIGMLDTVEANGWR